jgi:DNA mismatch endonuclease (patch repair protein)
MAAGRVASMDQSDDRGAAARSRKSRIGIRRRRRANRIADILTPAERSARMALIRSVDSIFELKVRSALHRRGYRYRKHDRRLPGKPDIVFSSRRKVVFLHGCFWHGHHCRLGRMPKSRSHYWVPKISGNRLRDKKNIRALRALGWSSLIIWECQLSAFDALIARIEHFLRPE